MKPALNMAREIAKGANDVNTLLVWATDLCTAQTAIDTGEYEKAQTYIHAVERAITTEAGNMAERLEELTARALNATEKAAQAQEGKP